MKQKKNYNKNLNIIANKLVSAFKKNNFISPIPIKYTKNINQANKLRKICESKLKLPVAGFKAGGTGLPMLKKLNEKEPFYASVYKRNLLSNNKKVKINRFILGIELEVCYLIDKKILLIKKIITKKNLPKFIKYIAPCIEIVGYRQKKTGIKFLGDLCSDFGGNYKFIIGNKIKFKNQNVSNLKTIIQNKKAGQKTIGNTNTVYVNPMNSLKFVINKIKNDKLVLDKDFYVFTGSTVGVVPILRKGLYTGEIKKLGVVKTNIT